MDNLSITKYYSEFLLVAKIHLAEYLNKPLLNIGFIFSLAIATSTLLSILVLNYASQQQYHQANNRLKSPITFYIVPKQGNTISKEDFSRLRKLGFYQLSPAHVFRKTLKNGKKITFRAIDILPLVLKMPESFTSKTINISNKYFSSLGGKLNDNIMLAYNNSLKVHFNEINDWGSVALLDITLAWDLFPDIKGFSHLMVRTMPENEISRLKAALPEYLSIQEAWSIEEREGFADALHLNLSALAILGFIVSLFIAYQAANQTWITRGELAAQLRLLGVELVTIQKVMLCESFILTLVASAIGIIISIALVSFLLPLLGLTLDQLYSLRLSGYFQWTWQYSLWAFVISAIAVIIALIKQFRVIGTAKIALSARSINKPFNFKTSFLITVLLLLTFILWPSNSWYQLMFKYGLLLMASVAVLPNLLRYFLQSMANVSHSFKLKFVFKDASQQVGRRYLPLAAFYLALTSSISAALMVNSFESAFVAYLNQVLNADLFISYKTDQKVKIETWLKQQDEIEKYVLFQKTTAKYKQYKVDVYALAVEQQYDSLLLKEKYTAPLSAEKNRCYINEQLAFKQAVLLRQNITIYQGNNKIYCQVIGIYYDYGNQGFAIKIPVKAGKKEFSGWQEKGFGIFFKTTASIDKQFISEQLSLDEDQIFAPEQIKKLALGVFEQTFILTQAIAFVLLSIACFGLFLSANSLEQGRKNDLHILSSLGYSCLELFAHMLLQWVLLACGVILLSWPVAIILANALVGLILPASFGWSMPLELDVVSFAGSSLIGLLILIPALAIPLYKLNVRANL